MTLIFIGEFLDDRNRRVFEFNAPSRTTRGVVYKVQNIVGTDLWSCSCRASTFNKACHHIPNGGSPPAKFASTVRADGAPANPGPSIPTPGPDFSPGQFDEATAEKILTLREMIGELGDRDTTFRRYVIERQSGPIVVRLLNEFFGFRISVPDGQSLESYLGSLPQFSTIRTASLDVLKDRQKNRAPGWDDTVPGERQERHLAHRRFYGREMGGQMRLGEVF